MGERRNVHGNTGSKMKRAGVIAVAVAVLLVTGFLFSVLILPQWTARRVLSAHLRAAEKANGSIVLFDPYHKTGLYPETRAVTLNGEEADAVRYDFLSIFSSCRYAGSEVMLAGDLLPYLRFRGEDFAVTFYLDKDAVLVEKNSTYHRFHPRTKDGKTAYAELYRLISDRLAQATEA